MKEEISCGAVLYTRVDGKIKYLIIKQRGGHYGFPKGHMEGNETELETARREIREEVGIDPTFIDGFREIDEYLIPRKKGVHKRVILFLAEYSGQRFVVQKKELHSAALLTYGEAMSRLTFDAARRILTAADEFLKAVK